MSLPERARTELYFKSGDWSCPLVCGRCAYIRKNGIRCKNNVCIGSPLCWIHNDTEYGVKATASSIAGAGKGLFATRKIPKDTWICPYGGDRTTMDCIHRLYPGEKTAPYAIEVTWPRRQIAFDCACHRGIGSLANCLVDPDGNVSPPRLHNCISRYRPIGDGVPGIWLKSTKTIQAGKEIFHWYGKGEYSLQNDYSQGRRLQVRDRPDSRPC